MALGHSHHWVPCGWGHQELREDKETLQLQRNERKVHSWPFFQLMEEVPFAPQGMTEKNKDIFHPMEGDMECHNHLCVRNSGPETTTKEGHHA